MDLNIKVAALAGEGAFSIGNLLAKLFAKLGYNVIAYPEYPSLIKGGLNVVHVRVSDGKIYSPIHRTDVLLSIGKDGYKYLKDTLHAESIVIGDDQIPEGIKVNVNDIIQKQSLNPKVKNMLITSVLLGILNYPREDVRNAVNKMFGSKSKEILDSNLRAIDIGYEISNDYRSDRTISRVGPRKYIVSGNEAFGLGAIAGGMKLACFYPMTPASSLFHFLISVKDDAKIFVLQAEDEIAAANIAVGANYAGVRAITGTSGGGFALMTETVSMAGIAETPIVFFVSQRVGPSTGMPTWTEQADLFQIWGAGQGDFPKIILAPGTPIQAYTYMAEALNLAQRYQLPVFVLSDKFLSETSFSVDGFPKVEVDHGKIIYDNILEELPNTKRFSRYEAQDDGISRMPVPGVRGGMHVASSYEHMEDSFSTESFSERVKQVEKRSRKISTILERENTLPTVYSKGSKRAIVVWGSQILPVLDIHSSIDFDIIHFSWVYPIDSGKIESIFKNYDRIGFVENNSNMALYRFLRMFVNVDADFLIMKYTGRPLFPHQLLSALENLENRDYRGIEIVREDFDTYELYTPWRY
ncbi:MAG: 2-oxoacid:acceptor oxidoreductase subunit alpha [Candidatus Micrarchaeota archaeon]|nr:2-oxoacid:acceptor oxidoreductase subunit alpha [Candidatus Micrarchaeota archaeon]